MVRVNVDNFARAETARMFDAAIAMKTAGFNEWVHVRNPTPVDNQPVIRMNRDTLYSGAVVNISSGATANLPDVGDRYMSVMVINEEHHINAVLTRPGSHELSVEEFRTPFVGLGARIFVDPDDPDDVAAVNQFQDEMSVSAEASEPYTHAEYDETSLTETRDALLALGRGLNDARHMFGAQDEVDAVRHLIGTANAWGGLPEREAFYVIKSDPTPIGHYRMTLADVPVDGFWSVSIYNRDGYFEANPHDRYNINSVTARPGSDGTFTIDLAPTDDGYANHLCVMDGWNYALRLYRPRDSVLDGSWTPPEPEPV